MLAGTHLDRLGHPVHKDLAVTYVTGIESPSRGNEHERREDAGPQDDGTYPDEQKTNHYVSIAVVRKAPSHRRFPRPGKGARHHEV